MVSAGNYEWMMCGGNWQFEPARDAGGYTQGDLTKGWVSLCVTLHRGGGVEA